MEIYTGTREIPVRPEVIDKLYEDKFLEADAGKREFDRRLNLTRQNEYLLLKSIHTNQAAITRVVGDRVVLIDTKGLSAQGVTPRNLEQKMLMDALLDDTIRIVMITGRAGSGKTLLTLAAAMSKLEAGTYDRLILTKPMAQVGKHNLGALPGDVDEKFGPYLDNYMDNISHIVKDKRKKSANYMARQYHMEFKPLQLIRGSSWSSTLVIADEMQVLNHHEMVTLGTRVSEGSKIIVMGDMRQRDDTIAVERTGMYKFINSKMAQEAPFVASIELQKCERGDVANLFADVFEV